MLRKPSRWPCRFVPISKQNGAVVAKYVQNTYPDAKVGVVYQNDDFGKDYVSGCWTRDEDLADCRRGSYELSDPTIETQSLTDS
jgi:branched-chain amino acid transport system substrate-binding protein